MKISLRMLTGALSLLLLAPASATDASELGRLFFTPERRAALERQRALNIEEAQTLQGSTMSLDGVVYRSSGKTTVWINQQAQSEHDAQRTGVSVKVSPGSPGSAIVAPGEESPSRLNVGESINRSTGERNTRLGGGRILIPNKSGP